MAGVDELAAEFEKYCNFGGSKGKKTLTTKNMTKALKDCKLYGKTLTTTDTDIAFSKVKEKGKTEITLAQFKNLLKEVAPKYKKGMDKDAAYSEMVEEIRKSSGPKTDGTTGTSKTGGVDKMTDASKYTGAHKERFDAEGKGKGLGGRENLADNSGYVGNYKGESTYDKKK